MTTIVVKSGEAVRIRFSDGAFNGDPNCDGEFEVHFDTKVYPNQIVVKETAGLPGSVTGEANAVLYREQFMTVEKDTKDKPKKKKSGKTPR